MQNSIKYYFLKFYFFCSLKFPPMFMMKKSHTGNFSYDGYFYDAALLIAEYFNATYVRIRFVLTSCLTFYNRLPVEALCRIEFINADQAQFIKYGYTPVFLSLLKTQVNKCL